MNHIMEYSRIAGYIVILSWHGQSQLKSDMSARSQKYPYPFVSGSLVKPSYLPQAPFFGKNDVPGFFETCNSPVEVFLRAAGTLFFGKMMFLGFV